MSTGRTVAELATIASGSVEGDGTVLVTDVTHSSLDVEEGALFVAIKGEKADGHAFVSEAVASGASAVAVEEHTETSVPVIEVGDTRAVIGLMASEVHDNPSHMLKVIGVTGTNGKTTVTHFINSIAGSVGMPSGLIGTINVKLGDETLPTGHTTPEASDFQRLLARMRDEHLSVVAAEVSSHALEFGRVRGTRFEVAAFTNLSQDHLDFHGDMESYAAAKRRLFTEFEVGTAVVNIDDPLGAEIAASRKGALTTVGLLGDVNHSDIEQVGSRSRFHFSSPWGSETVEAPVLGEFNVANLTMAAACCLTIGMEFESIVGAMASVEQVPGRFEVVSGNDPVTVVVDYAHTPEGVANAVDTGKSLTEGRVIALVGAGGDRDRKKRPLMGEALSAADVAVVTSDNPRNESPEAIVRAVAGGVSGTQLIVEVDRRKAIRTAIAEARDGDFVLVLGRGHEPHQQVAGERIEFDDRMVSRAALEAVRKSANLKGESGSMER